jgi:dihydroorotase
MAYLIKGVSVLGGEPTDLLIRDGHIAGGDAGTADVIDAAGLVALPGLVDLHTHLREPGREDAETVETGSRAAAVGGYTAVCAMANTSPVADTAGVVEQVWRLGREAGLVDVQPIGAVTVGLAGKQLAELGAMATSAAQVRIFSDDGYCVADPRLMRRALEYVKAFDGIIAQHAEEPRLTEGAQMHEGEVSTRLGLTGWPAVAEEAIIARDVLLAEHVGSRLHVCHVSTAGSVEVLRQAKARGVRVTAEVTPHHLLLTDEWVAGERSGPLAEALAELGLAVPAGVRYDTNAKVNPPLRSREDCVALLAGLLDGTIDAIATDHAPHTAVDKDCEFAEAAFGISGFETALAALLALVHTGQVPLPTLIGALTERPSRAWNLDAGTLKPGALADLVVFDPDEEWTVDPPRFSSKGRNTPLDGLTLRGRVRMTLLGGAVVYDASVEESN